MTILLHVTDHLPCYSLLVSPNPTQPWLAIGTTNTRQVQVYNYETHDLKYQLDTGMYHIITLQHNCNAIAYMSMSMNNCTDYEKAVVLFAPNGQ